MEAIRIPKRLIFYCKRCHKNPGEQPVDHIQRPGHVEADVLLCFVPDLRNLPKGAVHA